MRRVCVLVAMSCWLMTPVAWADDDANRSGASAAYIEGMDLRAAGKTELAVNSLARAHTLYPTAITGLELGRTYMLLGRLKAARETLSSVARIGPRANESARANNARSEAASLAVSIGERIPKLVFKHEGPTPAVSVDGVRVDDLDSPYPVDPGAHTVEFGGERRSLTLLESKTETVVVSSQTTPSQPKTIVTAPSDASPSRVPVWIAFGLAGAATVMGAVGGGLALSHANAASPNCPSGQCLPVAHADADAAKTWSTVSTISFVAAGVVALVTVVAFIVTRPAKQPPQLGALSLSF